MEILDNISSFLNVGAVYDWLVAARRIFLMTLSSGLRTYITSMFSPIQASHKAASSWVVPKGSIFFNGTLSTFNYGYTQPKTWHFHFVYSCYHTPIYVLP